MADKPAESTPKPSPTVEQTDRAKLKSDIEKWNKRYDLGSKTWSSAYHFLLFGSATLSAFAALAGKANWFALYGASIAAVCSGIAALFTTFLGGGGFSRKWRANRIARSKTAQLLIDIEDRDIDEKLLRASLKKIIQDEDGEILGPA